MTCSEADKACPTVKGATARIAVPYNDPKEFDGTPQETAKYDERCRQIATETLYIFSKVKI
jgi:arsenate reductase